MPQKLSLRSPRRFQTQLLSVKAQPIKIEAEKTLSQIMWSNSQAIAEKALQTMYIQGIKYGDLDPNSYGAYTVQDAIYCDRSTKNYQTIYEKAEDPQIKEFAKVQLESYQQYTQEIFNTWHIQDPKAIKLAPKVQEYADFENKIAREDDPLYYLISTIPCVRLWSWLAEQLAAHNVGSNLYSFWIQDNLSYNADNLENFIDARANQLDEQQAIDIYDRCMQGEYDFFSVVGDTHRSYLNENEFLLPGDSLYSDNQAYQLIYQQDGNLVIYETATLKPVWATDTGGINAWRTYMQDDGNLVVYKAPGQAVWAANVYGTQYKNCRVVIENDGKLVIYDNETPIWSS